MIFALRIKLTLNGIIRAIGQIGFIGDKLSCASRSNLLQIILNLTGRAANPGPVDPDQDLDPRPHRE